jgi:hypothetical protein
MASQITNLTNFADQVTQLQLPDGSLATMELIYQGTTERWIMNITYGTFTANGIGVCTYPNILRQWKEILPFGIAFVTADQTDPFDINDFSTGRVSVYLLDQTDIATIESTVFGGPQV